ncbi:hypothetical protein H181DRAFT_05239 [Streptomyces sp. WMMB 714]|jgi:hypothetical protein|nr:hypothetical protein H181DRAFT_05239 [Streptomyces sp. WMMB 714]
MTRLRSAGRMTPLRSAGRMTPLRSAARAVANPARTAHRSGGGERVSALLQVRHLCADVTAADGRSARTGEVTA